MNDNGKKITYADYCLEKAEKASPGPWKAEQCMEWDDDLTPIENRYKSIGPISYAGCGSHSLSVEAEDAEFITHSREAAPELARRLNLAILKLKQGLAPQELIDELEEMTTGK